MKKLIIFLLLSSIATMAFSQDTVTLYKPKSNYFAPTWVGDSNWIATNTMLKSEVAWQEHGDILKLFYTKEQLTVYGVAVVIETWGPYYDAPNKPFSRDSITVPDFDSCYEYLMLYEGDEYNWTLLKKTIVRETDTPACYFFAGRPYEVTESPHTLVSPKRLMECYFDEPAVVRDTFFVGMTRRTHDIYNTSAISIFKYWPMSWMLFYKCKANAENLIEPEYVYSQDTVTPVYEWNKTGSGGYTLLWPILTPEGYTGDYPPGGEGIGRNDALEWMVQVAPNPTRTEAKVLSSFGISHIRVTDAAGAVVLDQQADGYSHTLDVGPWLEGTYIVTVTTPVGTVTKKLVVQGR